MRQSEYQTQYLIGWAYLEHATNRLYLLPDTVPIEYSLIYLKLQWHQMATKRDSQPYWMKIRDRIDTGSAVRIINGVMQSDDAQYSNRQLTTAIKMIDKLMPSLQAVAVDVTSRQQLSKGDIESLLLSKGIRPEVMFAMMQAQPVETVEKKAIAPGESSTPPPPAESDE